MAAAALASGHDSLLPRPPGGNGAGALLALLVHAGLIVALTFSVDWRSDHPEVIAAELWASVPQVAAPPAPPQPEPQAAPQPPPPPAPAPRVEPPPPREPEIATEREPKRKPEPEKKPREEPPPKPPERKKPEPEKKPTRDDEARQAREAAAEAKRLADLRQEQLRRILGAASVAADGRAEGTAVADAAPSAAYAGRVAALIRRASVFTGSVPGNPATEVEVRAAAGGTILSRRVVKSSGHKPWDDAVLQAIDKTGTLPRDTDGRVPSTIIISFRPKDE